MATSQLDTVLAVQRTLRALERFPPAGGKPTSHHRAEPGSLVGWRQGDSSLT